MSSNNFTVPKSFMMISFFAETAVIGRLAAKRRQRWRKVRTSAQDRRFRLVAISIWTARQFITRSGGRLLSQALDRMALFIFASVERLKPNVSFQPMERT